MPPSLSVRRDQPAVAALDGSPTAADEQSAVRSLDARMREAAEVCNRAAAGDLEARVLGVEDDSEFAALCHSINRVLDMSDAFVREASAAMDYCSHDLYHRPVLLRGMRGAYARGAAVINAAISKMKANHQALLETASLASETANDVAIVAAACEELTSTNSQIAQQATDSVARTRHAVTETGRATETVDALSDAARQINAMVALITKIASQTNLLALNATIEAARAGEVGKGFAVVASEVKELSRSTAAATDDISHQVASVLASVDAVRQSIIGITGSIRPIDESASVISDSVAEQVRAIAEIAQNVAKASERTSQISSRMGSSPPA